MKLDKCKICSHYNVCAIRALKEGPGKKMTFTILGAPVVKITAIIPLDSIPLSECPMYSPSYDIGLANQLDEARGKLPGSFEKELLEGL